jgi:hypothetical protein
MWELGRGDPGRLRVLETLEPALCAFLDHAIQLGFLPHGYREQYGPSDPATLVSAAEESHGTIGREIAERFVGALDTYLSQGPCSSGGAAREASISQPIKHLRGQEIGGANAVPPSDRPMGRWSLGAGARRTDRYSQTLLIGQGCECLLNDSSVLAERCPPMGGQ